MEAWGNAWQRCCSSEKSCFFFSQELSLGASEAVEVVLEAMVAGRNTGWEMAAGAVDWIGTVCGWGIGGELGEETVGSGEEIAILGMRGTMGAWCNARRCCSSACFSRVREFSLGVVKVVMEVMVAGAVEVDRMETVGTGEELGEEPVGSGATVAWGNARRCGSSACFFRAQEFSLGAVEVAAVEVAAECNAG